MSQLELAGSIYALEEGGISLTWKGWLALGCPSSGEEAMEDGYRLLWIGEPRDRECADLVRRFRAEVELVRQAHLRDVKDKAERERRRRKKEARKLRRVAEKEAEENDMRLLDEARAEVEASWKKRDEWDMVARQRVFRNVLNQCIPNSAELCDGMVVHGMYQLKQWVDDDQAPRWAFFRSSTNCSALGPGGDLGRLFSKKPSPCGRFWELSYLPDMSFQEAVVYTHVNSRK